MRNALDMAREAGMKFSPAQFSGVLEAEIDEFSLETLVALVRADERGRMCEQLKECSSEKPTSNEANRSEVLGEGG
jgi:hypothetical protein